MARLHSEPRVSSSQPDGQSQNSARTLRAKIGAHSLHARYDSRDLTAPARKAAAENLNKRQPCGPVGGMALSPPLSC